ncbi:MAG: hypothetical protein JWN86_3345 [Planctomycetota bacterium]|nr:hypothetical protein [Planctomycetota bacterium]
MTGRNSQGKRRAKPVLEALEGRQLLNARMIGPHGKPINDKDFQHFVTQKQNNVAVSNRRIAYTTPDGAQVQITLFGIGTLAGTTVRPDGALNLVYNNTTNTSKIVGHVLGGTGHAPLASVRDADTTVGSPSATGTSPINVVNLKKFDLIDGGIVNLLGGVSTLALASAGSNTQILVNAVAAPTSSSASNASAAGTTLNTVTTGGVTTIVPSGSVTPSTTQAAKPTGGTISIPIVNGTSRSIPVGDPQVFGFDPTAGTLVRFNANTGAALQAIPVPGGGTAIAGVGLGRNNGREVALVGTGTTIFAYDVVSGSPVGQFSTASLGASGLRAVDGIGSSDTRTFVSDAMAGTNGLIQGIDVTASLRTGQAVPLGLPFAPAREFELSGGVTGLAGSDVVYSTGAAHFDSFVPDQVQVGILAFSPTVLGVRETARTAVLNPLTGTDINVGPPGSARARPTMALGSIGGSLALVTAVVNGQNVVTLLNPTNNTPTGAVSLNDPNRLAGLSESFHPELAGGALVNVTGTLLRFTGHNATGLVLNASSPVNLVAIDSATDTAIIGRPLNHVAIPVRNNVAILSTARGPRGTSTKGGITVLSALKPFSILTLP